MESEKKTMERYKMTLRPELKQCYCIVCGNPFLKLKNPKKSGRTHKDARPNHVKTCSTKCARTYRNSKYQKPTNYPSVYSPIKMKYKPANLLSNLSLMHECPHCKEKFRYKATMIQTHKHCPYLKPLVALQ